MVVSEGERSMTLSAQSRCEPTGSIFFLASCILASSGGIWTLHRGVWDFRQRRWW